MNKKISIRQLLGGLLIFAMVETAISGPVLVKETIGEASKLILFCHFILAVVIGLIILAVWLMGGGDN